MKIKLERENKMNVKPKNLNVMKRIIFTLMAMVVLVLVANTTFAQSSVLEPAEGTTYNYSWGSLDDVDAYLIYVTDDSDASVTEGATTYDFIGTDDTYGETITGNPSSGSAGVDIEWIAAASYKVWIQMTDFNTGCTNYRYVNVVVSANDLDFFIVAIGLDNDNPSTLDGTEAAVGEGPVCAGTALFDSIYDSELIVDDGDVYAYFRIERDIAASGNDDYDWYTSVSATINSSGATVEYAEDWSATDAGWGSTAISSSAPVGSSTLTPDNSYFIRVLVTLEDANSGPDFAQDVVATITGGTELTSGLIDSDVTAASNVDNIKVWDVPTIGGFTGN